MGDMRIGSRDEDFLAFFEVESTRLERFATMLVGDRSRARTFSFHAGEELIVEFSWPEVATDVVIAVDDDRRPLPTEFDPETGRATATLDRDLAAGRHVAVVIVRHRSGRLYPEAIVFKAAAP